jgi:hypothetical protein
MIPQKEDLKIVSKSYRLTKRAKVRIAFVGMLQPKRKT